MNTDEFEPVTEALPPPEAEKAFALRLLDFGLTREDLDPVRDIIIDTFRTEDGILRRRYRIRRALIENQRT